MLLEKVLLDFFTNPVSKYYSASLMLTVEKKHLNERYKLSDASGSIYATFDSTQGHSSVEIGSQIELEFYSIEVTKSCSTIDSDLVYLNIEDYSHCSTGASLVEPLFLLDPKNSNGTPIIKAIQCRVAQYKKYPFELFTQVNFICYI